MSSVDKTPSRKSIMRSCKKNTIEKMSEMPPTTPSRQRKRSRSRTPGPRTVPEIVIIPDTPMQTDLEIKPSTEKTPKKKVVTSSVKRSQPRTPSQRSVPEIVVIPDTPMQTDLETKPPTEKTPKRKVVTSSVKRSQPRTPRQRSVPEIVVIQDTPEIIEKTPKKIHLASSDESTKSSNGIDTEIVPSKEITDDSKSPAKLSAVSLISNVLIPESPVLKSNMDDTESTKSETNSAPILDLPTPNTININNEPVSNTKEDIISIESQHDCVPAVDTSVDCEITRDSEFAPQATSDNILNISNTIAEKPAETLEDRDLDNTFSPLSNTIANKPNESLSQRKLDDTFSPQPSPSTSKANSDEPDDSVSLRPLDETYSPEKSVLNQTFSPPAAKPFASQLFAKPLGGHTPLKGIRKRSISMDNSIVKLNKSVMFHSPSNQTLPIDEIDRIMERSHFATVANKENAPKHGKNQVMLRKRSMSNVETSNRPGSAVKVRPVITPKKLPDFKSIHQRNFDKMESISDYKNRVAASSKLNPLSRVHMKKNAPSPSPMKFTATWTAERKELAKAALLAMQTAKVLPTLTRQKTTVTSKLPRANTDQHPTKPTTITAPTSKIPRSISLDSPLKKPVTSGWKPPVMAIPSFNFVPTEKAIVADEPPPKQAATGSERGETRRREQLKGHTAKTAKIAEANKQILRGVRSNRRFDLQMKFRQEHNDS